ncbi:PD-(D/E)XK nuclease family protein [bacterium]|nr:PD-(D/E)XK nuclease family protein [bacterium]
MTQTSDDALLAPSLPHLSYSQASKYLTCPEQYRLHYLEGLRPTQESANLVFGKTIHQALACLFQGQGDPVAHFQATWESMKDRNLRYAVRETWEKLREKGTTLLGRFVDEEYPKIGTVHASEKPFTLTISSLDLPFVGIVDLVADVEGKRTVIDFKTASSTYEDHEVALSDQLTAYQLAEPSADQSAFIVLVKTKEPRIDWYLSQRTGEQLREYLEKLGLVAQQIQDRVFFKRPGQHCSYCDFLPVCLGDRKQIEAMLTTVG